MSHGSLTELSLTNAALALGRAIFIPKGFKLIAVGERCATPTDSIDRDSDPEGVTLPAAV